MKALGARKPLVIGTLVTLLAVVILVIVMSVFSGSDDNGGSATPAATVAAPVEPTTPAEPTATTEIVATTLPTRAPASPAAATPVVTKPAAETATAAETPTAARTQSAGATPTKSIEIDSSVKTVVAGASPAVEEPTKKPTKKPTKEATEVPAETPEPTQPPVDVDTVQEGDVLVVIEPDGVNLRADPSTENEPIGFLEYGDTVTVTGEPIEAEGYWWIPVLEPASELEGYVAADFMGLAEE